jgi:hypothetical protein
MRRLAFAGAALLVIGIAAAVVIPHRGSKQDARSILIAAAQAAEEAKTIYAVVRGTEDTKDTPSGMKLAAATMESWISTRAVFGKLTQPDGTLAVAIHMDLDASELWVYVANERVRYVADFAPIKPKAGKLIAGILDQMRWAALPGRAKRVFELSGLHDVKESVTSKRRDGRELKIVTVVSTLKTSPQRVTDRWVFEVDAQSNHLLTARRYVTAGQGPEELILSLDRVEYDVPPPAKLSTNSSLEPMISSAPF